MNSERIIDELTALVTEVEEGNTDPLKAYIDLKRIEKVLASSIKQIGESAVKEAKLEGAKQFDKFGATIQVKDGAARYSYKHIPQWEAIEKNKKEIETAAKNRALNPSLIIADADGVEIPPAMVTYDKESIAVTIKNF